MSLTGLFVAGLSLFSLTEVGGITDRFEVEARRVDVVGVVHTMTQADSERNSGQEKRVDVIETIRPHGPAYPYARPMNR